MQSPAVNYKFALPWEEDEAMLEIPDIDASVMAVQKLLQYRFKNKKLLEEALTHPSYTESPSYQRLEFVGDAALGLAISNFFFIEYPDIDPGKLSLVRAANISTEKLARVAVRHKLYMYVRHNATVLDEKLGPANVSICALFWGVALLELKMVMLVDLSDKHLTNGLHEDMHLLQLHSAVKEFVMAVQQEKGTEVYGGLVKAPKVLADIVESVAAAVYFDCNFDLEVMWKVFRVLLEPIVMLDILEQQPQPVTMLFEMCQKDGKQVDIRSWRKDERTIATVYVDGQFIASASSEQKENARLHAAKAALRKLSYEPSEVDIVSQLNGENESGAKQKLHELCSKKKWPKPNYKIQKEVGRSHEKRYTCSVEIEIAEVILFVTGNEKPRVKEAENSAAFVMLHGLKDNKYI